MAQWYILSWLLASASPSGSPHQTTEDSLLLHNSWHWVSWKGTYWLILSDCAQLDVSRWLCQWMLWANPSRTPWCHANYHPRGAKQPAHKPWREGKVKFSIEREESILILRESPIVIKYLGFAQPNNQTRLGFPSATHPRRPFLGFHRLHHLFSLGPSLEVFN